MKGHVENFLAGCVDLVGLTVVDLVWRHQADASMVVILIIPIEEAAAEGLRILDAAEPLRKLGLASRGELSPSALSDPSVNSRLTRLPSDKRVVWIAAPVHEKTCTLPGYPGSGIAQRKSSAL